MPKTPRLNTAAYKLLVSTDLPDWEGALCKGMYEDTDMFFPDNDRSIISKNAQKVCVECPIRVECLKYALDNKILYGVWGGLTSTIRRDLLGI